MPGGYLPDVQQNTGLYVGTTNVWEFNQLLTLDVNSEEFKLLLVRLYQNVNDIAVVLNWKDSALYTLTEFIDGQQFFSTTQNPDDLRSDYRILINVGVLGAGVTTVTHNLNITTAWTFTRIYGTATDNGGGNYYPLPFASAGGANNIELRVDNTNVVITNNSGITFNKCYVILEYLKN